MCEYAGHWAHECASDCVPSPISVRDWAKDELDYPTHDDVALTENERNRAIDLLLSLNKVDEEPNKVVLLRNTDIETLQSALFCLDYVLRERHRRYDRRDDIESDVSREVLDSIRNVKRLFQYLDAQKETI